MSVGSVTSGSVAASASAGKPRPVKPTLSLVLVLVVSSAIYALVSKFTTFVAGSFELPSESNHSNLSFCS